MLDVSVRAQVLKVLMDLRESRSLALLFITHDLGLAWTLCDRIAVMYLGRIVEQGSAAQVIEHPRHPYTQALVAAVPVAGPRAAARSCWAASRPTPRTSLRAAACTRAARIASSRATARTRRCSTPATGEHRAACLLLQPSPERARRPVRLCSRMNCST